MPEVQMKAAPATPGAQLLSQRQAGIVADWSNRIETIWGRENQAKLASFIAAVSSKSHAMQYLGALLDAETTPDANSIVVKTIERVQSESYNIADLFCEIGLLHDAIGAAVAVDSLDPATTRSALAFARRNLDRLFEEVARETSVVYEYFAECGKHPLLILQDRGIVTYANASARLMIGETLEVGRAFNRCLADDDRSKFDQMLKELSESGAASPICATLRYAGEDRNLHQIDVEITRLEGATERSSFYVSISSTCQALGVSGKALEEFEEGIIRIDAQRRIVYANASARRLMGTVDRVIDSARIEDFFDGEDRNKLSQELQRREQGQLGSYRLNLTRLSGKKIPVSIDAIPEFTPSGGHSGSVAIVKNLFYDHVAQELAECVLDSRSWQDNLAELCHILFKYVDADMIFINRYTEDMHHTATLCSITRDSGEYPLQRRWFPLSEGLRNWISEPGFKRVTDFPEFLQTDKMAELRDDPDVQNMLATGVRSFLATPVLSDGTNRAIVSLAGKGHDKFGDADEELLSRLHLGEIVTAAIQRHDRENKAFQFRLMTKLSRCNSFEEIARRITKELAYHYKWDNVSIFDVAVDLNLLTLIKQRPGSDLDYRLKEGFTQASDAGLLGKAVREQRRIYAKDVSQFEEFIPGNPAVKSELVVPIFSTMYEPKRVFWLLNIEDSHTDFLNQEELDELAVVTEQIEFVVNRMLNQITYSHAVKETTDGIIVTDANGDIRMVNPAALELLEFTHSSQLIDTNVADLFNDRRWGEQFVAEQLRDSHKVELRGKNGQGVITVLLSKLVLPRDISDKYFVFKSLQTETHLANLDAIDRLVSGVASQLKTPISLLQGMLNRLEFRDEGSGELDLDKFTRRARGLLRRVELTYDRLAYAETMSSPSSENHTYVHLERLFDWIDREYSFDGRNLIELKAADRVPPVYGDRHQLRFACDSLVAYLMRNMPRDSRIEVVIAERDDRLIVSLQAPMPETRKTASGSSACEFDRIRSEIVYGSTAVNKIIDNHQGRFEASIDDPQSGVARFTIDLPVARTGEG